MAKPRFAILGAAMFAIAGCGGAATDQATSQADEFAARIKGTPAPAATMAGADAKVEGEGSEAEAQAKASITPSITYSEQGTSGEGPYVPGTASDPNASVCGAPAVRPFLGRNADDATRAQIVAAVGPQNEVRFVIPGSTFINPDPTSARLNVMIDNSGVIRDARCG